MKVQALLMIASLTGLAGCIKPADPSPALSGAGAPVLRAYFLDGCSDDVSKQERLEFLSSSLIDSAIGFVIDKAVDAITTAAAQDEENFVMQGVSPDYLYTVGSTTKRRTCIAVVVASRKAGGTWCDPAGNWPEALCPKGTDGDTANVRMWKKLGLGKPAFYAKISLASLDGKKLAGYAVPELVDVYYPAPLANRDKNKIEGLTIAIQGRSPAATTTNPGETQFEVVLTGEGLVPGVTASAISIAGRGEWIKIPKEDKPQNGDNISNPVNLTVTLTETPHINQLLKAVAKYVSDNREKAKTEAINHLDPEKVAAARQAAAKEQAAAAVSAAEACSTFIGALSDALAADTDAAAKERDAADHPGSEKKATDAATARAAAAVKAKSCSAKRLETTACTVPAALEVRQKALCP